MTLVTESAIVDGFVATIQAAHADSFKVIEAFEGGLQTAIKRLANVPSVLVVLGRIAFTDADETGDLLQGDPAVQLLVGHRSLRSKSQAAQGTYDLLETLRDTLHDTDAGITGTVWHITEEAPVDLTAEMSIWSQTYTAKNAFFTD